MKFHTDLNITSKVYILFDLRLEEYSQCIGVLAIYSLHSTQKLICSLNIHYNFNKSDIHYFFILSTSLAMKIISKYKICRSWLSVLVPDEVSPRFAYILKEWKIVHNLILIHEPTKIDSIEIMWKYLKKILYCYVCLT